MNVLISNDKQTLGRKAAAEGAEVIRRAIQTRGEAHIIVATGASQFETVASLVAQESIAWERVTAFHLDEYVGVPVTHPASFRKYLWERFHRQLPRPLRAFHYVDGEADPQAECRRLNELIRPRSIDAAFVGIGENGHLAFNDPPADWTTEEPFLVVTLDEACRRQQLGEGWFATLDDVPRRAISMSCRQIMKAAHVICSVPDQRKARAVKATVEGPMTPEAPASILQQHPRATLHLDRESASLLGEG